MSTTWEKLDLIEFANEHDMCIELEDILGNVENLEDFLGVEFAFEDGTFPSDDPPPDCDEDLWWKQEINYNIRRPKDCPDVAMGFPKSFPAKLYIVGVSPASNSDVIYCRWAE